MSIRLLPLLSRRFSTRSLFAGCLLAAGLVLSGCVSAPVSYRLLPDAATKTASFHTIAVVPPDAEVRELNAGGVAEIRDEWSTLVGHNLSQAIAEKTGYKAVEKVDPAVATELAEVSALLRAITLNHLFANFNPQLNRAGPRPLSYHLGPVDKLADAFGADALLFVFVRDSYATAGRKTLAVLGILTAAVTGVAIVPQMGSTIASAALVERDGTVVWFNLHGAATGDLRVMDGARSSAETLLVGLPRK